MPTNYLVKVKRANDYALISVAYHEASHTICALHNFCLVKRTFIRLKECVGNTIYETYDVENTDNKFLIKILNILDVQVLYAGLLGEKIYYKDICGSDKFPMNLRIGSWHDIKTASKTIIKYNLASPGKSRFLFKKQIQNDTRQILTQYWDDVKLIAHLLYKHKELNLNNLKYYLTRNSINKKFWKEKFKQINIILNDSNKIDDKTLKEIILNNAIFII